MKKIIRKMKSITIQVSIRRKKKRFTANFFPTYKSKNENVPKERNIDLILDKRTQNILENE